jgi:lia operon protein LiaG
MRLISNSWFWIMILLFFWSCNIAPKEVVTDVEETYTNIREIKVKGGSLDVSYRGGEVDNVHLVAYLESSSGGSDGVRISKKGTSLEIEARDSGNSFSFWNWGSRKGYIHITGPIQMALEMQNSSGVLEVENVISPQLSFRISSGKMEVSRVEADRLQVQGSSGKISAQHIEGGVEASISSGMLDINRVRGNLNFKGSSGSVSISDVEGKVEGSMRSGKASLKRIQELGSISLTSGMLTAEEVGFGPQTRLEGSSGLFKVKTTSSLNDFNFDINVGSGMLTIGDGQYTSNAYIDRGSEHTVRGKINSGKMEIK